MGKKSLEFLRLEELYKEEECKRVSLSIKLGYCPTCGEKLISETPGIEVHSSKGIFGRTKTKYDIRTFCPSDLSHYNNYRDYESYFMMY